MYPVSDQWVRTVPTGFRVYSEMQVWENGLQTGSLALTSSTVNHEWMSGVCRTVSLSVRATRSAKQLLHPNVELRPFSGINYGGSTPEILPMGVFPVLEQNVGRLSGSTIDLTCDDKWQLVARANFPQPRPANKGMLITDQIVRLLVETGLWTAAQVTVSVSSPARVGDEIWDTNPSDVCIELAKTIGAEVFLDRFGNPVLRPVSTVTAPVATFLRGPGGRLMDFHEIVSVADVYNAVVASSTSDDPAVPTMTYTARITDPTHPAYIPPGQPDHVFRMASAQFRDRKQMQNAAEKRLTRLSQMARQLAIVGTTSDASLDASDTILTADPDTGKTELAHLQTVEHHVTLDGGGQAMTTVSTRTDEDLAP